ncbi:MAG TPA: IPT/TIG domain-containing protein, partial [Longimicrobiales bacterium]|nr:IPT/TIG domain-containing protein [Longimicrobiales bacterium]
MRVLPSATLLAIAAAMVLTGCQEAAAPLRAPEPVITAITPDTVLYGSQSVVIRVAGRGFHPETQVRFNDTGIATRFLSTEELEATVPGSLLYGESTADITAFTPAPGGGASQSQQLRVVRAATPVLTGISPESADYGGPGFVLTVTGREFLPQSYVRWGGVSLATTYVSATELRAEVPAIRLIVYGTADVSVVTPVGGAGGSQQLQFRVIPPTPVITVLPSRGATAGRPGFTLMIHGEFFGPGASVRWNGEVREATPLGPGRLAIAISSADVATPRSVDVSVINIGDGESEPVTFEIRSLGPATASVHRVPLHARDLAWDPGTARLYVSVGGTGVLANTITAVDPYTGDIQQSTFVGSLPNRLARSDDGQFLYVGLDGASAVRQLTLATFTPGLEWVLGAGEVAQDIEVAPGQPHVVAVSRHEPAISPSLRGVTIYDAGMPRSVSSPGHTGASRIEFLESPSELYGFNNLSTGFDFFVLAVDEAGARHVRSVEGLIYGFSTDIIGAAGRIYSTNGAVVDAGRGVRIGTAGAGYAVAADPVTGRLFYLLTDGIAV